MTMMTVLGAGYSLWPTVVRPTHLADTAGRRVWRAALKRLAPLTWPTARYDERALLRRRRILILLMVGFHHGRFSITEDAGFEQSEPKARV